MALCGKGTAWKKKKQKLKDIVLKANSDFPPKWRRLYTRFKSTQCLSHCLTHMEIASDEKHAIISVDTNTKCHINKGAYIVFNNLTLLQAKTFLPYFEI